MGKSDISLFWAKANKGAFTLLGFALTFGRRLFCGRCFRPVCGVISIYAENDTDDTKDYTNFLFTIQINKKLIKKDMYVIKNSNN